jgi:hypothetical protein
MASSKLQRRLLERAFDHGADVRQVAQAIEMARTEAIVLSVLRTASSLVRR